MHFQTRLVPVPFCGHLPNRPRRGGRFAALGSALLLLSGCGNGEKVARAGGQAPVATRTLPVLHATPPPLHVQQLPGVEGVIGADAAALIRLFGKPRLDAREGDARKLQFAGTPCVLDVYLYPLSPGHAPVASFVSTRRAGDGREVDRAACIALLRRR
jgi:hypothetical protein